MARSSNIVELRIVGQQQLTSSGMGPTSMMNGKLRNRLRSDKAYQPGRPQRLIWLLTTMAVILFALALVASPLLAQENGADSSSESQVDPSTISADQVNEIARELWCPLCSGVRLDSCELKACDQMKDEIAIKLAGGDGLPEIKTYFVAQYGPQVLGEPPREGFNLLAWILPFVVLIGGGVFLITRGRKIFRNNEQAGSTPESSEDSSAIDEDAPSEDPYARQLEDELKQYD
jgi:cytochrome c-type biogenesis protein CcmH